MVIRIFDSAFNLKTELTNVISAVQTRYINDAGSFEIKLSRMPDADVGDFIYTTGSDCQRYDGIITNVAGETTKDAVEYVLSGYELTHLLSFRVPVYNGALLAYHQQYAEDVLRDLVEKLFISPDTEVRRIPFISYTHTPAQSKKITVSASSSSIGTALALLGDVHTESGYGLLSELRPNVGQIDIRPCIPDSGGVILSPLYDNLSGEFFSVSESTWKNIAYYSVTENDVMTIYTEGLNAETGWRRRETAIAADSGDSTLAQKAAIIHMQLGNYKRKETYSGNYVESGSFEFGTDFDLGSIVHYKGAYGQAETQVIGYTQTIDTSGYDLQLQFGDNSGSMLNNIKRISGVG